MKRDWKRGVRRRLVPLAVVALAFLTHVAWCASSDDTEARLRYLVGRVERDELPGLAPSPPFDGEWRAVTLSMTALAASNLAFRHPNSRADRAKDVEACVARLLAPEARRFDTQQWGRDALDARASPEGHAGYLGHLTLAMGAACTVGAKVDAPLHQELIDALAHRLDAAPSGLIETYPAETYVPDNAVVVAAIALFDRCHESGRHDATINRWLETMKRTRLDPKTGVLTFAPGQAGRGSGAAWNLVYLPYIDAHLAATQRAALWRSFEWRGPLGLLAVREFPPGVEGKGDVDSGPLVLGVSPAATGFALASAAWESDEPRLTGLVRTAETFGFTVGLSERRYLLAPLVGDAITLAGRTATPWDARFLPASASGL